MKMYTSRQAAELTGKTVQAISRYAQRNGVGTKYGNSWIFNEDEIARLLAVRPRAGSAARAFAALSADRAAADAEIAQWRGHALAMLEVIAAVEHLADGGEIARDGDGVTLPAQPYDELTAAFRAWRSFTERGVPLDWQMSGAPAFHVADAEIECLF